jgi:RNA polymerase sigma factor (sigma-70 family)
MVMGLPDPQTSPERRGGEGEYERYFRSALPKAIALAYRVTGDRGAAEDAAVEALAKAHVRWHRLVDQPWREAWVLRVAVNEAIDSLPRRLELPRLEDQLDPADEVVLRHALRAALRSLPRRQREVIALRHLVGLSEVEIARTLNLSHGTVKTHLRRGLAVLRRVMSPPIEEDHLAHPV